MLDRYLDWLTNVELGGRPDAPRVAADLEPVVRRIAAGLGAVDGRRVLDLGTGTGAVAAAIADLGARVVGVDIDVRALSRGPGDHGVIAADARALPFPDGVMDASVHRSVLVHMEHRERAVAEEFRVLAPGARVSASESLAAAVGLRADDPGLGRVWSAGLGPLLHEGGALALDPPRLEALYRTAGFMHVRVEPVEVEVALDSAEAVARAFTTRPPVGEPPVAIWRAAGLAEPLVREFLARLAAEAERGRPARLVAAEGFLTARRP